MTEVQNHGSPNGAAAVAGASTASHGTFFGASTITRDDPRYDSLLRGTNHRFVGSPDYVRVVSTTRQVVEALDEAVAAGKRLAVRSGGHGQENFIANPEVKVLLDISEMTGVSYDASRRAFAIESGATLGHVYRVLFKGWGVTIPGGMCPEVGVGGHFAGGGFGPLSRTHGAVVDYLYAVEVVVVGEDGKARVVVGTREPDDPNHDLWWAHTGGGGGNFGIVTRYWVRTPDATSADPAELLPKAPAATRNGAAIWSWDSIGEDGFRRLMRNFGDWCERNNDADSPFAPLFPFMHVAHHTLPPGCMVGALIDDGVPGAEEKMAAFLSAVGEGIGADPFVSLQDVTPWLYTAAYPNYGDPGDPQTRRFKLKAAYHRKGYNDQQIAAIYRHMKGEVFNPASLLLVGYGGKVNTVAPDATATAQRDSIFKAAYQGAWASAADDEAYIDRIRELYADIYAETGGAPVPNDQTDGAYINYPDADLADPALNTSGVPWHDLYYKGNYPRLQQIKKRYDPRNVFRHVLSIQPPQ
ncbi:BBE domain-containing protein [Sphaerisporangium sp. TRM90804]|uniref:FAD-dependent oxidoreductase n=1 Tax=Sphaerisporangium sp. TRM90804 TaxID=3031113 RepID=UPI0024496408|nr:BBE domain-containing protein [Sphaerisporangium sp. TRM90804]MDH2424514.1 FAD-binding protein [Sphaerisporangium sp. TRM90804]